MIYFDSTYIAKFYLDEPESDAVRVRAEADGDVCCSGLGRVEVVSVFHRKWREGSRTKAECHALIDQFESDCTTGMWTWLPLSVAVLDKAAAQYRILPDSVFLRAHDAIHLAAASEVGLTEICSNDRRMLAAAPHFGLTGTMIA